VIRTTSPLKAFLHLVAASVVACLPHRLRRHEERISLRLNLAAHEAVDKLAEAA
jgi:hypothetical protein